MWRRWQTQKKGVGYVEANSTERLTVQQNPWTHQSANLQEVIRGEEAMVGVEKKQPVKATKVGKVAENFKK